MDNVQQTLSRLTNTLTIQERRRFLSQPQKNPRGIHEVNANEESYRNVKSIMTLRRGRKIQQTSLPTPLEEVKENLKKKEQVKPNEEKTPKQTKEPKRIIIKEVDYAHVTPPPFPSALRGKKNKNDDLCTVKRGFNIEKEAFLTQQLSVIIENKIPIKHKDPGCPTISVTIGETHIKKTLLDLGASVNILPYLVFKQFGLGELVSTSYQHHFLFSQ